MIVFLYSVEAWGDFELFLYGYWVCLDVAFSNQKQFEYFGRMDWCECKGLSCVLRIEFLGIHGQGGYLGGVLKS